MHANAIKSTIDPIRIVTSISPAGNNNNSYWMIARVSVVFMQLGYTTRLSRYIMANRWYKTKGYTQV